jgi:hypothetical protein
MRWLWSWLSGEHVLHVLARYNGRTVDERYVPVGRPLRIGSDGDRDARAHAADTVQVPVPDGGQYVARVLWRAGVCLVQDQAGTVREVRSTSPVGFEDRGVSVTLTLARPRSLPVMDPPSLGVGAAWAVVVLLSTVGSSQSAWLADNFCSGALVVLPRVPEVGGPLLWLTLPAAGVVIAVVSLVVASSWRTVVPALLAPLLGLLLPVAWTVSGATWRTGPELLGRELQVCLPDEPPAGADPTAGFTAEYLARLLRKDYAGEEDGHLAPEERPQADKVAEDDADHYFMPAGSVGPATKMGGAAEKSLRPVRTVVVEAEPVTPRRRRSNPETVPQAGDTPTPTTPEEQPGLDDATVDGADEEQPDEGNEPPSEETEGWGIPGWYDEQERAAEKLEIDIVLRMAKRRLAIDPDDVGALGILSYYQYLAQDYKSALRTYDKMLQLDPEDAAAYNNKALVYKRMEQWKKEEGLYRQSLAIDPGDTTALNNLAVNLSHQGRYDEALAVMKGLETSDPDDPYADLHRAKIHAQMGHDEEAYRYLELALKGMAALDTLHHIEFRQDIRIDPSFANLRGTARFKAVLTKYYGKDSPLTEGTP